MNRKLFLVIVVILATANAGSLQFDLQSTKYTKANDYWTIDVPCTGGSGRYTYSCDLPSGWKLENNYFKIPSSYANQYSQQYVSRCKVQDNNSGSILERSLLFKCTTAGYVVSDRDYYYGQTTATAGSSGSITGLDVLKRLSLLGGSINLNIGSLGGSYGGSYGGSVSGTYGGSVGGSYGGSYGTVDFYGSNGLPSWTSVDVLIKDCSISEILQLIQKVVSSSLKCEAKTAYLNDLLGRILSALQIKKESVQYIKTLIQGAITQIEKLTIQIQQVKTQQSSLQITVLKQQLEALLVKLKAAYAEYNTCTSNNGQYDKELAELKIELATLQKKVQQITYELDILVQQLNKINAEIQSLEARLVQLKQDKTTIETKIVNFKATLKTSQTRITEIKARITLIISKINEITTNCSNLKKVYEQIQIEINSLKQKIVKVEAQYQQYDQQIISINIEIERIRSQITEYELKIKSLQQGIENLNNAIKQIKESINFIYYNCNDVPDVIIDDNHNEPCFNFGINNWFNYLSKCYGTPINQIQTSFTTTTTIQITTVNVFSSVFQSKYGSCFGDQIKTIASNYNNGGSYGFDGDFSCSTTYSGVTSKKGTIKNITNKYVDVSGDDGSSYKLKLGSCSRFEGNGIDFIPKVGQQILWKGSKNTDSFNLHSCTCY